MTHEDKIAVVKYLKSIDVRTMEFFEEMYDHIITSYQNRVNKHQTIKDHLRDVVQPAFGGVKGIQKVMKSQQKLRQTMITRRAWHLFKSYLFRWPSVLITISITLIIYQLNNLFEPKHVLMITMAIGGIVPAFLAIYGSLRFYMECKSEGRPYTSSDLNLRLMVLSSLGCNIPNLSFNFLGFIIFGSAVKGIDFLSSFPVVQISIGVLFVLYMLVYSRIFKEKFIFNLTL